MKDLRMKKQFKLFIVPISLIIAFIIIYVQLVKPLFRERYESNLETMFIETFDSLNIEQDIFTIAKRNGIDTSKLSDIKIKPNDTVYSSLKMKFLPYDSLDELDKIIYYIFGELNKKCEYHSYDSACYFIDDTTGIQLVTPVRELIWNDFSEDDVYNIFDNTTKNKDHDFVDYPWGESKFFREAKKIGLIKKIPIITDSVSTIWVGYALNMDKLKIVQIVFWLLAFIIIVLFTFLFYKIGKLRETKHELDNLSIVARNTDNCVFILDEEGKILWANENDGFKSLYGVSNLAELKVKRGKGSENLSEISFLDDPKRMYEIINNTKNNDKGHQSYYCDMKDKNGDDRIIKTDIYYYKSKNLLYTIDTDITEQKHYEKVAKFADKCKDIISDVSNLRSYQHIVEKFLSLVKNNISENIHVFRISHPGEINGIKLLIGHVYEPYRRDNSPTYHISKEKLDAPDRLGVVCYTKKEHKLIITKNYHEDFGKYIKNHPVPEPLNKATYKSHVWYRIERGCEKYGYFSMQSSDFNTFSLVKHKDYIEVLGGYIAIAIKYMQTQNQENTRFDELTIDLSETINRTIFKDNQSEIGMFKFLFEEVKKELEGYYKNQDHFKKPDCFVLLKYNKEKNILEGCISEPSSEKDNIDKKIIFKELDDEVFFYDSLNLNESELPAIKCFKTKKPILINDYKMDREFYNLKDKTIRGGEYEAFIYVPISNAKGDVFGVMSIQNYDKYTLTEYDLTLFKIIANYVSLVLQSLQKHEELLRIKDSVRCYSLIEFEQAPNEVKEAINGLDKQWNEMFGDGVTSYNYANQFGREIIKVGKNQNFIPLINYGEWLKKRSAANHNFKELKDDINFFKRIK